MEKKRKERKKRKDRKKEKEREEKKRIREEKNRKLSTIESLYPHAFLFFRNSDRPNDKRIVDVAYPIKHDKQAI